MNKSEIDKHDIAAVFLVLLVVSLVSGIWYSLARDDGISDVVDGEMAMTWTETFGRSIYPAVGLYIMANLLPIGFLINNQVPLLIAVVVLILGQIAVFLITACLKNKFSIYMGVVLGSYLIGIFQVLAGGLLVDILTFGFHRVNFEGFLGWLLIYGAVLGIYNLPATIWTLEPLLSSQYFPNRGFDVIHKN